MVSGLKFVYGKWIACNINASAEIENNKKITVTKKPDNVYVTLF